jgi:hypothetical protein
MFCFAQETIKLLPSCDNFGGTCGVQAPWIDLCSHSDHPSRRDLEIVGARHPRMRGRLQRAAGLEQKLQEIDE